MRILKFSFVLIMLLIFVSPFFVSAALAEVSKDEAASALANAEGAVTSSYQAVLKAEESGANVSSLLVRLNEAGALLARAHMAYNSGDLDSALKFATQCQEKLTRFVADADVLREAAIRDRYMDFMVNVVGSIIGAISAVCVGFIVWSFLKRKYEKAGSTV
jgi:hypothetical protein